MILIILGLRSSDSTGPAAAGEKGAGTGQVQPQLDTVDMGGQPEVPAVTNHEQENLLPEGEGELPFVLKEETPGAGAGEEGNAPEIEDPNRVEEVPAWDGNRPDPGPPAADNTGAPKSFELGKLAVDTEPLAVALLESWIAQSPALLQAALDKAEPGEASEEQGKLVTAFWQCMVGHPELAKEHWSSMSQQAYDTPAQLAMLAAAMEFDSSQVVPDHAGRNDPLARAMRMVLLESAAARHSDTGSHADAARALSELLTSEVVAPWQPHREALAEWAGRLNAAQKYHRLNPRGDWPAITHTVAANESLELVRKRVVRANPGLLMCTGLIHEVNGVGRYIHPGDVLRIPTSPSNMLVDLDARMAFYRHGSEIVMAWPVGIGREGHATPVGTFTIGDKLKEPVWTRRGMDPLPYGHPENLLGSRWLGWYQDGAKTDYGFHGTNDPDGVGGRVSSGCIRMRNEDVSVLFELLPSGNP
ncbi:MAG: L,D-transpeptidase, partial [Planctomycetes bacterium]|nr:L,D-transpeptidase [Planctomycetota bacterium]